MSSGRSATVSTGDGLPPTGGACPNQSGVVSPPWQFTKCESGLRWVFVGGDVAGGLSSTAAPAAAPASSATHCRAESDHAAADPANVAREPAALRDLHAAPPSMRMTRKVALVAP